MPTCRKCGTTENVNRAVTVNRYKDGVPITENFHLCPRCSMRQQLLGLNAWEDIPVIDPFETDLPSIAQMAQAIQPEERHPAPDGTWFYAPEIERIKNGAVSYFAGAFINDGMITWYAFDFDRQLFIAVLGTIEGNHGRHPTPPPKEENLAPGQRVRTTPHGPRLRREFVTLLPASAGDVQQFATLANELLKSDPEAMESETMTDTFSVSFDILRSGKKWPANSLAGGRTLMKFISDGLQDSIARAQGRRR